MSRNLVLRTRRSKKRACLFRKAQIKKVDESSLRNVDPKKKPVISNRLFKRKLTNRVYEHVDPKKNPHQMRDKDFKRKATNRACEHVDPKKKPVISNRLFKRKATTYSPTKLQDHLRRRA